LHYFPPRRSSDLGGFISRRGVLWPERILVRRTQQAIHLGAEVLVGVGSRSLEDVDRLLVLALRQSGLCEQDAGLLRGVGAGEVLHHLGQHAGGERVVLRIEGEASLRDLAAGAPLRGLRGQEVPREERQSDEERHCEVGRQLLVAPDPAIEPRQRVGLLNRRTSRCGHRRRHTPSSRGCEGGWKLVEVGGGRSTSASTILHNLHLPSSTCFSRAPGVTRTPGQRFRKPLLYPPELQGLSLGM